MTDAELEALVARLNGAGMGLCSEDASKYVPRGVSAQTCVEAAAALTTLRKQRDELREALEEIAATGQGRQLNWGDAQDAIDIARQALSNIEEPRNDHS